MIKKTSFIFIMLLGISCSDVRRQTATVVSASKGAENFSSKQERELIDLYETVRDTRDCHEVKRVLISHPLVSDLARQYHFRRAYLYHALRSNYSYEPGIFKNPSLSDEQGAIFHIVSYWILRYTETSFNEVAKKINTCSYQLELEV